MAAGYTPYPEHRSMAMSVVSRQVSRTIQVVENDTSNDLSPPRVRNVDVLRLGPSDPIDGVAGRSPSRAQPQEVPDNFQLIRTSDIQAAAQRYTEAEATAVQAANYAAAVGAAAEQHVQQTRD